jgi:hypothetical protein
MSAELVILLADQGRHIARKQLKWGTHFTLSRFAYGCWLSDLFVFAGTTHRFASVAHGWQSSLRFLTSSSWWSSGLGGKYHQKVFEIFSIMGFWMLEMSL